MYTVVLLAALTSNSSAPDLFFHGGCHGCTGWSCHGCAGCCGGCHGGYACTGGCAGGCHGAVVVGGCWGGCTGGAMMAPAAGPAAMPKAPEKVPAPKATTPEKEAALPAPATIIVSLPAEAKLTIDDAATTSTGAVRTFVSPNLDNGRDYHYDLKAEVDGKTLTKRITVRAGEETRVEIDMASLAAK